MSLQVEYFADKGRGVVTTKLFEQGTFVIEYIGELITKELAVARETTYSRKNVGNYMFYFTYKDKKYW